LIPEDSGRGTYVPCLHALGENYRDKYAVSERERKDGTTEESCTVSVGPYGSTEEVEVIISREARGLVYSQMRTVIIESRNLL